MLMIETWVFIVLYLAFGLASLLVGSAITKLHYNGTRDEYLEYPEDEKPIMLDEGAYMPTKAHREDAGFDLYAREDAVVPAGESYTFDTGVHILIPDGYAGVLISKSGLNVHDDITSTGLIDAGYTGSIAVKLYNHGPSDKKILRGMKISQIMFVPIVNKSKLVVVDSFGETERGSHGFGSSGV